MLDPMALPSLGASQLLEKGPCAKKTAIASCRFPFVPERSEREGKVRVISSSDQRKGGSEIDR